MILPRFAHRLIPAAAMGLALFVTPASASEPTAPIVVSVPAAAAAPARPGRDRATMNRRVFDAVWSEVRGQYYDPDLHGVDWNAARRTYRPQALAATDDRGLYRVLGQMLDLLDDQHAGASAPAITRRNDGLRQRRPVLGLSLRRDETDPDLYTIESVRAGSPADLAGVTEGWRLRVGAQSGWAPEMDVIEGQAVDLSFTDPEGQAHAVRLSPQVMEPQPAFVADTASRPGVAVLRIDGFEAGLGRWLGYQLASLDAGTEVVLDLRGNPGGRLMEADAVLSCFLPADQTWATRTARSGRRVPLRTAGGCGELTAPVENPVAVLVDANSRSAAELTPAALQEAGRAVVVGAPTAGAVLISQETRLPDGGKLVLSRADFVTAGGVRLEKRGVTPDVEARTSPQDRRAGRDPALDAAIAALTTARRDDQAVADVSPTL